MVSMTFLKTCKGNAHKSHVFMDFVPFEIKITLNIIKEKNIIAQSKIDCHVNSLP